MDFSAALPTLSLRERSGSCPRRRYCAGLSESRAEPAEPVGLCRCGVGIVGGAGGCAVQLADSNTRAASPNIPVVVEPLLEECSVVAIAMLSWMLIWMTRQARFLKPKLREP